MDEALQEDEWMDEGGDGREGVLRYECEKLDNVDLSTLSVFSSHSTVNCLSISILFRSFLFHSPFRFFFFVSTPGFHILYFPSRRDS